MKKPPKKTATQLGSFGERVARERAARRRAAKQRAARTTADERIGGGEEAPAEPEIIEIPQSDLANELSVLAALIAAGLARHHTEAKRLFKEQGILVNGSPVLSDKAKLTLDNLVEGGIKLGLGTTAHVILKPV